MAQEGLSRTVLSSFYAFKELVFWMVKLNKHVNDSGSRQMESRNSGHVQMEGVVVGEVSYWLRGSI